MIVKNVRLYIDGVDIASYISSLGDERSRDMHDATTLDSGGGRKFEVGRKNGKLSCNGIFEDPVDDTIEAFTAVKNAYDAGSDLKVLYTHGSLSQGDPIETFEKAKVETWSLPSDGDSLIFLNFELMADNGGERGITIFDGSDTGSGTNGSSVDNSASSANGGYFQAHVYALSDSGNSDGDITLQHSTNDSTWVDLVALQSVGSAVGVVEGTVAEGTTVNRYLRVVFQATGGKAYCVASFVRR